MDKHKKIKSGADMDAESDIACEKCKIRDMTKELEKMREKTKETGETREKATDRRLKIFSSINYII